MSSIACRASEDVRKEALDLRKPTRTIHAAGGERKLLLSEYRKAQALIRRGNKLEAVAVIRRNTGLQLKAAKAAVENPDNFDQSVVESTASTQSINVWQRLCRLLPKDTSLREWMASNPSPVVAMVAAVLVLSMAIATAAAWAPSPRHDDPILWYYDLGTDELFQAVHQVAPIDSPSGARKGVLAHVFACGQCTEGEMYVGYLEKFSDEARALQSRLASQEPPEDEQEVWQILLRGHLIRSVERDAWVTHDSNAGRAIRDRAKSRCPDNQIVACYPE